MIIVPAENFSIASTYFPSTYSFFASDKGSNIFGGNLEPAVLPVLFILLI